jgi:hypothetical protein
MTLCFIFYFIFIAPITMQVDDVDPVLVWPS